jgi:hypothetical protein
VRAFLSQLLDPRKRQESQKFDVRITTTVEALEAVIAGDANVASLRARGQLVSEVSDPEAKDLDVFATMQHFWKALSDASYRPMAEMTV